MRLVELGVGQLLFRFERLNRIHPGTQDTRDSTFGIACMSVDFHRTRIGWLTITMDQRDVTNEGNWQ